MNKKYVNIAVYGSLRKGLHNHGLLNPTYCTFAGYGKTLPEYTLFPISSFPGVKRNGNTEVHVEVYKVDQDFLPHIDALEGYRPGKIPTFYDRQEVQINMLYGETISAFMYIYVNENSKPIIESGDWVEYLKQKK